MHNTFPIALGLKTADGWEEYERTYLREIEDMTSTSEPIMTFHGGIHKIVPVFCVRLASLADRPERAVVTSTISYTSNLHRCHGVSGRVVQPKYDKESLGKLFSKELTGSKKSNIGWSHSHLSKEHKTQKPNGEKLASCPDCRQKRVQGLLFQAQSWEEEEGTCHNCTDWNLLGSNQHVSLDFPVKDTYPKGATAGSPVPPPAGRDTFQPGGSAPFIEITFDGMKQASKFAFYQASRPGKAGSFWGKGQTVEYLKLCGIGPKTAEKLHECARQCAKDKEQEQVDYTEEEKIHTFAFPPSWCHGELEMSDYIETVMHQIGLGVGKSNYELFSTFLKDVDGLSKADFHRTIQPVLLELKAFRLGWLQAHPLHGGVDAAKHTTGGWVGENWMCYIRLSKFFYAWCCRDQKVAAVPGVDDLRRTVNSYHAFVSRCMTHSGIDDEFIKETESYMKEFLSSVKELDIRIRHGSSKKQTLTSEKKKNTAPNKKRKADNVSSSDDKPKANGNESSDREDWHLKSNYMSLPNLINMMRVLGPLVLWWDGGGK